MKTIARLLLLVVLAAAALAACGRTVVTPRESRCVFDSDCGDAGLRCVNQVCTTLDFPDAGPKRGIKRFGEPCDAGAECDSTRCVGGPTGAFCTQECEDAGCPYAYDCKGLVDPDQPDGGAFLSLCTVPQPLLCQGCTGDLDCGASGADKCLSLDGGRFCGRDCTHDGCPELFTCTALADGTRQCVPTARTCDCVPATLGMKKSCRGEPNAFGRCLGSQVCQEDGGFTDCNAPPALEETCNGVDDDCNGRIDDSPWPECTKTVGTVTCRGPQVCFAGGGLVCTARPPSAEACNGEDDDCNGTVDDGFRDPRGRYTTLQHCGACGNDCRTAIAHATATTCDVSTDAPRCRATACEAGYFPYEDGALCLELPDTLCFPCQVDVDCTGPGSRCLTVDGQKVCGRDCSASSAYPPGCPGGYSCQNVAGGPAQCVPTTGTCTCRASTLGSMRSCTVQTCKGFETCAASAGGPTWSTCDVSSFNPEICDGKDNNCNGQTDEGFKNPVTGRYDTAGHCGFCNNDCTKYFSPVLQHTTGVCDTAPAMPRCAMGPCLTQTVGGVVYEWVNVNGETADGCECRRVQGNTTVDLPDRGPSPTGLASWVDENCDGIDGVVGNAIFVSATANPGGNGSRTAPFQTITQGLAAMQAQGKTYVLVAQGLYRENVRLFDGAQLFGGYASDFLKRDPQVHTSTLQGVQPTGGAIAAIHAEALGNGAVETVVSGFTIKGWDVSTATAVGAAGDASIAVYLRDVGARFVLQSNDVLGGRGGEGGRGATGAQGFGRQASPQLQGARGINSQFFPSGTCSAANHRAGGTPGVNVQCAGANATAGGSVVCPVYTFAGNQGQQQQYVNPPMTSRDGRGGWDWSFDTMSGFSCSHVTESGFPVNIQQHDGDDGKPGADGMGGTGGVGAGALARFGSISGGRWVASPTGATLGGAGGTAQGGGGGGAGGGVARFTMGGCQGWEIGATGGGGGAGGCGGTGGQAGGAGGASIALLIVSTAPTSTLPTIRDNRFQRGAGGNGGNGGFGGAGGLGGGGGFGGDADRWSSSVGGKGGEGGNGGPGGGGGGGAGGPSFAWLAYNVTPPAVLPANTFLTPSSIDTGGPGGAGGSSPGAVSSSGTPGSRGASNNVQWLRACSSGCLSGTTCDANGVCIPN